MVGSIVYAPEVRWSRYFVSFCSSVLGVGLHGTLKLRSEKYHALEPYTSVIFLMLKLLIRTTLLFPVIAK